MSKAKTLGVRERQKIKTRKKILEVALEVFAENGFHGSSIRQIAARANVIHGLIKYHFGSKDDLWRAAVTFLFERQNEEMKDPEGYAEMAPLEQARDWIRRYVHYCARYPEHARILIQESLTGSDRLAWVSEEFIKVRHAAARERTSEFVEAKVYPDIPVYAIFHIIAAAAQLPFVMSEATRQSPGVDLTDPIEIERYADSLLTFLLDHSAEDADEEPSRAN